MQIDSRLIGFTAHRESSPFSKLAWAICSIRRSPDPVKDRAHPSSRNSSSECLRPQELAVHLSMSSFTCPWVSFPLRDITRAQLRFFAEHPRLHFAPSSGFHNLSTVSSALELAGLFHPAATSRVLFRSGGSLPPQPPFFIRRSLPPCRCCFAARTHGPTFAGSLVRPRATLLGFEALICARPRSLGSVIHLARGRSPLRIPRSSRISLSRRRPPLSQLPSAHDVARSMFNSHFSSCDDQRAAVHLRGTGSLRFARANRSSGPRAVLLRGGPELP
jgi:hypothetical protein